MSQINNTNNNSKLIKIENKLKELHLISLKHKFWNISEKQGEILAQFVKEKNPKNVLEIGTSNGYSALYILKYLDENSILTTIEVDKDRFEIAKKNFAECDINNINQINKEIMEIIELKELENKHFDFIFLDAMQRKYLTIVQEFEKQHIITNNTLIIADNVLSHKNMKEFIEYMQKNYNTEIININDGFLIAKK